MQIAPEQGQFMQMLVRLTGARRAIEVGVFTGYSSLAVMLAMPPDGRLLALDVSEEYTADRAPALAGRGRRGPHRARDRAGRETLDARLAAGEAGRYDFAFIDADKTGYLGYYERLLKLLRPGGLIVVDNTLWERRGREPARTARRTRWRCAPSTTALHRDPRIDLALLPIGDGLTLARLRERT